MRFADVPAQAPAKAALLAMVDSGRLPHALLLLGQEGTGGLPMGLALAQYLFCTARTEGDACGHCADCSKVQRLEHPDLHLSFPAIPPATGKKALSRHYLQEFRDFVKQTPWGTTVDWLAAISSEGKAGNIPAEESREIIEALSLKSYEGGRKVLLLWRPEYLGKEGNILLKLIEEPPAGTVIVFVAENTEDILPTILSRVQAVRLAPIPAPDLADALARQAGADPRRAATLAAMAAGSYTEALRLLRHPERELFADFRPWMLAVFKNWGLELARAADDLSKDGREGIRAFLEYAVHLLGVVVRHRHAPGLPLALPPDEAKFVQDLARNPISHEAIARMTDAIGETAYRVERNANSKAQLLALGIQLSRIVQGAS